MSESDFGKGLVVCLVKFAEHAMMWVQFKSDYVKLHQQKSELFDESDAVELLFNGASDHLYEIEVPEQWKGTEIETKVNDLKNSGLEIGHGSTGKKWTEDDVHRLFNLAIEIAVLIDKQLGLDPDTGQW